MQCEVLYHVCVLSLATLLVYLYCTQNLVSFHQLAVAGFACE